MPKIGNKDDDLVRVYDDQAEIIMPAYVTSKWSRGQSISFTAAGIHRVKQKLL